jgi:hypothetical protein
MVRSLADRLIQFYTRLRPPAGLPRGVEVLFPFSDPHVKEIVKSFFYRYFDDNRPRHLILGINPGRFGAGTTGINFTAPRQLTQCLGIDHPFRDQSELSAEFIYGMIGEYGGPAKFYGDYFIGSVSPLGFIKKGINLNYYDDPALRKSLEPFIAASTRKLVSMGFHRDKCYCIGGDKNFRYLDQLNAREKFFGQIIPLPHPRFIMQYRRKKRADYVNLYLEALKS